jgi:hypothetical protein
MKRGIIFLLAALFSIAVVSANLDLRITDIIPSSVSPDEDFTVGIQIENRYDYDIKNLTLEFKNLGDDILLKENKMISFENLRKNGGIESLVYHFHVSPNVIDGERIIELRLSWISDVSNQNLEIKEDHSFSVNIISDEPKLSISGIKSEPERILPNQDMIMTIKIENYGDGIAKNVRIKLEDLPFIGTKEVYLGEIQPHEDLPARFILKTGAAGDYKPNLKITYEIYGSDKQTILPLDITVFQKSNSTLLIAIAGIILLAIILTIYGISVKKKREQ